jgi:alanine dehydrogenase
MAIMLTAADVYQAADIQGLVGALDEAHRSEYSGKAEISERINLRFGTGWIRLMAAALPDLGIVGYKEFHLISGTVRFQINLFDIHSGELLACMDGNRLTVLRTAATAGLAAARLAPRASVVGIIGSGAEARAQATVISQLLDVERMFVYSPHKEHREQFAEDLSAQLDVDIRPAPDGATAVADADLIMVATNTAGRGPAFFAHWIPATAHVSSTGSTLPEERELDSETWRCSGLIVVDRMQCLEESGDAIEAAKVGMLDTSRVITLAELCSRLDRDPLPQRTLYKSVGSPLQDVAAAAYVYQRAKAQGLGIELPVFLSVKSSPLISTHSGSRQ